MPTSETLLSLKAERDEHRRQAAALDQAIALLEGNAILIAPDDAQLPKPDFADLGIVAAAARFIKEMGEPVETGELTRQLLKRGWQTNSKKPVATVYATLSNSPDFVRVGSGRKGRWHLKEHKG